MDLLLSNTVVRSACPPRLIPSRSLGMVIMVVGMEAIVVRELCRRPLCLGCLSCLSMNSAPSLQRCSSLYEMFLGECTCVCVCVHVRVCVCACACLGRVGLPIIRDLMENVHELRLSVTY